MRPSLISLRRGSLLLSMATALLAGCASGPTTYTTSVQSYAAMSGITLPTTYRIELLPSQIQHQQDFSVIEAAAQQALNQIGLQAAAQPAQAHLVVQIDAINVSDRSAPTAYDTPFYGGPGVYGWGFGRPWAPGPWAPSPWNPGPLGAAPPPPMPGMGWAMSFPTTVFHRSVNVVIRDTKTQRIVYETSAQYNDMQSNDPQIWGILFSTALKDFPNPPQGVRQVSITVPPTPTTAATTPSKP